VDSGRHTYRYRAYNYGYTLYVFVLSAFYTIRNVHGEGARQLLTRGKARKDTVMC
jgi:hypothetical protein